MANSFEKAWVGSDFFTCPVCGERFYIPPYVTELKGEHYLMNANKWQKKNYQKRKGKE